MTFNPPATNLYWQIANLLGKLFWVDIETIINLKTTVNAKHKAI
jgi:hypothetical protein